MAGEGNDPIKHDSAYGQWLGELKNRFRLESQPIVQQPVAQLAAIPWGHNVHIISKCQTTRKHGYSELNLVVIDAGLNKVRVGIMDLIARCTFVISVLRTCVQPRLRRLAALWALPCILGQCVNIVLTISRLSDYSSPNTPAKPMLFSNNTLKLSGLFFAYCIHITGCRAFNAASYLERLKVVV